MCACVHAVNKRCVNKRCVLVHTVRRLSGHVLLRILSTALQVNEVFLISQKLSDNHVARRNVVACVNACVWDRVRFVLIDTAQDMSVHVSFCILSFCILSDALCVSVRSASCSTKNQE